MSPDYGFEASHSLSEPIGQRASQDITLDQRHGQANIRILRYSESDDNKREHIEENSQSIMPLQTNPPP